MLSNTSLQMFASGGRYVTLLLSVLALTAVVGCPDGGKVRVIDNLPSPAFTPLRPGQPSNGRPNGPSSTTPQSIAGKTIMIDPGHGGHDPGAGEHTRSPVPEKTIVLDIGNRLAEILQDRGAKVICTRRTDTFISLENRANAADRFRVDLFISIHADSAENPSASGTEVYIYRAASSGSSSAAQSMVAAIERAGIECRGIQRSNFHVLREHSRPAMLIECGFMTNSSDARNLNSPAYRARLAAAIADGAAAYLSR